MNKRILDFSKPEEIKSKTKHDIIQNITKEKRTTCIVKAFKIGERIYQGNELNNLLFEEVERKFNPSRVNYSTTQAEGVQVKFQEFTKVMKYLNDKKAHGIDGMPITYLRRLSY